MLKKLSNLNYKINNSGTVTIYLGNGNILKISPIEILVIANEIITKQSEETKLIAAENIYEQILKTLDIPESVVKEIKHRLHNVNENTNNTKENKHAIQNEIEEKDKMLYQFVSTFVNDQNKENEFEIEEFSIFDHKIKDLPHVLGKYGFQVEIKDKTIKILLDGEKIDEQQFSSRNTLQRTQTNTE